jgi:hypothetical protein
MLCIFLLYEYQLGEESFWFPYIDLMPDVTFFCDWKGEELLNTQDQGIINEAD